MGNSNRYLPSGQFLVTVGSLLLVGGLLFVASNYQKGSFQFKSQGAEVNTGTLENLIAIAGESDKDGDGLSDWEEVLWKTDPNKKDTDGDGVNDKEEIALERNPAIAGPNDKFLNNTVSSSIQADENKELNATDIFAREFFSKYAEAKKSGVSISGNTEADIISQVLTSKNVIKPARGYSEGEFIIINDISALALKRYGNEVGNILKENPYENGEDEISILTKTIQRENKDELVKLDPIILGYENILKRMLKVTVPKDAVSSHIRITNSVSAVLYSIQNMKNTFKDPVSSLVAIGSHKSTVNNLSLSFYEMQNFFALKGIYFSTSEDGRYFTKNQ